MAYTGRSQTTNRFGQVPQTSLPGTGPHSLGRAPDRAARPVMVAGYIGLDKQQIPHSSVLTRTAQQIGGSFGTAVLFGGVHMPVRGQTGESLGYETSLIEHLSADTCALWPTGSNRQQRPAGRRRQPL